jgi:DNA (cytosine-5)-methyltransferase 1
MTLTVGSLFAGIGGIELGLEWAGEFATSWQVERDEYCRKVLAKHWPNAERFDDVRTVGAHNLSPVDVICGGFPCQDISNAGKRAGIDGERSGLWREYARIVRELRPRYVLVENVAALLGRGLDVVLGDLAACGYDAEWSVLSAQNMGAPHLRERLFVVAYAVSNGLRQQSKRVRRSDGASVAPHDGAAQSLAHPSVDRRRPRGPRRSDSSGARQSVPERAFQDVAHTDSTRLEGRGEHRVGAREWPAWSSGEPFTGDWRVEPGVGRVASRIPKRVDRLRALGNAVVPQCAEYVGRIIIDMEAQRQEVA